MLRLRSARFGPVFPAFPHPTPRRESIAARPVSPQAGRRRRRAQPSATGSSRDLSAKPRDASGALRHGLECSTGRSQGDLRGTARGVRLHSRASRAGQTVAMTKGARVAIWILAAYKKALSPLLPRACRFEPTCSVYAQEAIRKYGLGHGLGLTARRLARCHPFNRGGCDPVP